MRAEFEGRVERSRAAMAIEHLDALLITSEANFRYFTGFDSQTWVSPTRPRYLVLSQAAPPIAIVPTGNLAGMRTTWIADVRCWQAPNPQDDGVSLLAAALRECGGREGVVGAEIGAESRLGMPVDDFLRLQQMLTPIAIRDGGAAFRAVRAIKSPAEVARIRHAATMLSDAFDSLPGSLRPGMTEREACSALHVDLIRRGVDKVPYLVGVSGPNGSGNTNMGPSDRVLARGDILFIDAGCTFDGYFCDFNRHFSFGSPCAEARKVFDAVYRATESGLAAVKPERHACDVWQAMSASLTDAADAGIGRMGHGVGLLLTEPPSLSRNDRTILEAGMVVTVEPGVAYRVDGDPALKLMVHEENIVITDTGMELLSRRAPASMPIVD